MRTQGGLSTLFIFATLDTPSGLVDARLTNSTEASAVQARPSTTVTRRPQRVDEGAGHSAFGFAFCTLRRLCALLTLRLSKGLAWCCDLLLHAWHLGFGRVTRRGLSG
jgi:hypothetical protein